MIRPPSASSVVGLVLAVCLAEPLVAQGEKRPRQIDVIANDYAFLPLPSTISAGPTIFTFRNEGKVLHEVNIARLKSDAKVEEFVKADAPHRRALIEASVGVLFGGPGIATDGRILVDLLKGRNYIAYCQFKDTPDAPAHLTLGMYTIFTPK